MTIFGTDISSYQHGLAVASLPDAFVLMKCTEDVSYVDADYPLFLAATKASGKLPIVYHFIGPSDPAAQAAHLAAHIIDRTLSVMIDFEDEGSFHPTLAQLLALIDAMVAQGLRVKLAYLPRWMWQQIGSPSLGGLTQRGVSLVASAYPVLTVASAGQVYAAAGGDSGPGWAPYGGITPLLWQFSDRVADGGQQVDMNAFRGSLPQLAAYLQAPTGGTTVGTIPASIGEMFPEIAGQFPAGSTFDDETALIWADGGARAAAVYAKQARDAVTALAAHVGAPVPAPVVDVAGLAAALGPLLHPSTDVSALAAALVPHLPSQPDPAAFAEELVAHLTLTVGSK